MFSRPSLFGVLALLAILGIAPASGHASHAVDVRAVRVVSGPQSSARVEFDVSGRVAHHIAVIKNPDRLVLDVADVRLARGLRAVPAAGGVFDQVRMSMGSAGKLRVVFDLVRPIRAKSFLAAPSRREGYRLVIELAALSAGEIRRVQPAGAYAVVKAEHARPAARDLIIAVDAGHGGEDPGAIGKNGTQEKDVVLAIARALAQRVDGEPGMKAVLTRDGDYFVPLRDRMRRARAQQADLFVSIHADSIRDRSVDGSSVYILSQRGATDEASRWLAERENAADLIGGVSLDDKGDVLASVLLDLSQSAALSASEAAAGQVLKQLNRVGEIRKPQVQQARFVVLKSPDIPSMLVETAYISNPQEEQRLRGAAHQAMLAGAIHQGVRAYFYADPPAGTRIAELAGEGASRSVSTRPVMATAVGDTGG